MAKQPNTNSPKVPKTKIPDGKPSKRIEIILPAAKPNIKIILEIVAAFQNRCRKIPKSQKKEKPKYKPIMALKIENSSDDCKLTSKRRSGLPPYTKPTGATIAVEIIRCSFLKKGDVGLISQMYKNNSNSLILLLVL